MADKIATPGLQEQLVVLHAVMSELSPGKRKEIAEAQRRLDPFNRLIEGEAMAFLIEDKYPEMAEKFRAEVAEYASALGLDEDALNRVRAHVRSTRVQ